MRHREHREVEAGKNQPPDVVGGDLDPQLLVKPENRAGLAAAGGLVISRDDHDRHTGQCLGEPLELAEREHDGKIAGPDRLEEIPRDDDRVGAGRNDPVHRGAKGVGDVGLALIDPCGCLAMVLPEAEVQVGKVGDFHETLSRDLRWSEPGGFPAAASRSPAGGPGPGT